MDCALCEIVVAMVTEAWYTDCVLENHRQTNSNSLLICCVINKTVTLGGGGGGGGGVGGGVFSKLKLCKQTTGPKSVVPWVGGGYASYWGQQFIVPCYNNIQRLNQLGEIYWSHIAFHIKIHFTESLAFQKFVARIKATASIWQV